MKKREEDAENRSDVYFMMALMGCIVVIVAAVMVSFFPLLHLALAHLFFRCLWPGSWELASTWRGRRLSPATFDHPPIPRNRLSDPSFDFFSSFIIYGVTTLTNLLNSRFPQPVSLCIIPSSIFSAPVPRCVLIITNRYDGFLFPSH